MEIPLHQQKGTGLDGIPKKTIQISDQYYWITYSTNNQYRFRSKQIFLKC